MKAKDIQLKIIILSITNILFLKNWISLGVFNYKDNYFSLNGIDKNFFLVEIFIFFIFFIFIFYFIKYIDLLSERIDLFFKLIFIILSLNSIRSVSGLFFLSFSNYLFQLALLILFFLLLFIFIYNKKILKNLLQNSFSAIGLLFFPFFLFTVLKLVFGLVYLKQYDFNLFESKNYQNIKFDEKSKDKVIWIILDQFDSEVLEKNLDKFPSIKYLISKSDVYKNFNPGSFETIRSVPAILSGVENNKEYLFKYNNRNIDLYLGNKNKKILITSKDSIFEKAKKKNHKIYINSWYLQNCRLYINLYNKCFQVAYGETQLLKFYNFQEIILLNLYNILPGMSKIATFLNERNSYFEKIENLSQVYYWHLNNFKKQNEDFLNEIKKDKNSLIFYQSIMPHPPIIYNYKKNKFFNNYSEVKNYMKIMKIDSDLMEYNYENFFVVDILLKDLIKTLKTKKQFESSVIIIHGDTGLFSKKKELSSYKLNGSTPIFIKNKFQNEMRVFNDPIDPIKLHTLIEKKF